MKNLPIIIITGSYKAKGALAIDKQCKILGIESLIKLINDDDVNEFIDGNKKVIFRIKPSTYFTYKGMLSYLSQNKAKELKLHLDAFNKASSYKILSRAGIPIPATKILDGIDKSHYGFPLVIKEAISNQGKGVFLAEKHAELEKYFKLATNNYHHCVLQEYIKESKGIDKRFFVVGPRVIAAMVRYSSGHDFRSNIHLGGRAVKYIPNKLECDIAINAVKAHGLLYAGVDIIDSNRGPLVLEVNPSPGFGIQQVTGINVINDIISI